MAQNKYETVILAAGCFWGVEDILKNVEGVIETTVGYTGGHTENPTYKEVCTDTTGHAEAVKVVFDPDIISYRELLDYFWRLHDPTTLNRQGSDAGHQYRSAIFYFNEKQQKTAEESKAAFNDSAEFKDNAVTEIVPAETFFRGEEYHQDYFEKNGGHVCRSFKK